MPAYQVPADRGSTSSACSTPVSCPSNGRLLHDAPPFVEENRRPLCAPAITKPRDFGTARTSSASPPNGPVGVQSACAASRVTTPVSMQKNNSGPVPELTAVLKRDADILIIRSYKADEPVSGLVAIRQPISKSKTYIDSMQEPLVRVNALRRILL